MTEIIIDLPDHLINSTLKRKLEFIAVRGKAAAEEDPNYGTAQETQRIYFRVGPAGQPYGHSGDAVDALNGANDRYAHIFGGRFDGKSRVFEEDRGSSRPRGWLLIRFIPGTQSGVGEWGHE